MTAQAPRRDDIAATRHVVIVGGGITGLAAAYAVLTDSRARELRITCTIVERERRLGGKLQTVRQGGCLIETGPDSFLATKPQAAHLCRALGLGDRLIGTLPGRGVYIAYRRSLYPLPDGLALGIPSRLLPILRSGLLGPIEKLRLGADLILPRNRSDGDESVGAFLRRRLGPAAVDRLAGPLLAGIYAGDADALSLRATFPQLGDWEASHRSLVLAAVSRRRQMRATPNGASPMFLSLTDGMGELVGALEAALARATVLTGQTDRITQKPVDGRRRYHLELGDGRRLEADAVLLATPAFVTADLLAPMAPDVARHLRGIPYVSTAAVTLAYHRDAFPHRLGGHGFVVARGEPLTITACTWMSSKWPHRAPPNLALLRCYLGAAGRDGVVDEDDERLVQLTRADLRTTMGIDAEPTFVHVARWPKAMPQYPPGHLERLEAIDTGMQALPGLVLAGAGYRGIGIPDCIRQGTDAASRILDTLVSHPALTRMH